MVPSVVARFTFFCIPIGIISLNLVQKLFGRDAMYHPVMKFHVKRGLRAVSIQCLKSTCKNAHLTESEGRDYSTLSVVVLLTPVLITSSNP
jgi:uncharacterized membrane protein YuzA (DUF378 family)